MIDRERIERTAKAVVYKVVAHLMDEVPALGRFADKHRKDWQEFLDDLEQQAIDMLVNALGS